MHGLLLKAIKERSDKQTEFGYGIMTADRYVRNMQQLVGLDTCYRYASTRKMSFDDAIRKASQTLVYSNPEMVVQEKANLSENKLALEGIEIPKNTLMVFKHVLTTPRKDRDGDVLRTEGALIDPKMLLLWQHVHTLPIGKMLAIAEHNSKRLTLLSCIVDGCELSHDAAVMVDNDMARFSHGFRALEFTELKEHEGEPTSPGGFDIKRFEIMEESIVSVPSNADAEVNEVLLSLVEGGKLTSGIMKEYGKTLRDRMPVMVVSGISLLPIEEKNHEDEPTGEQTRETGGGRSSKEAEANAASAKTQKGIKTEVPQVKVYQPGKKNFDVELEHLEASKLEYEWTSRWLNCQVKQMEVIRTYVPSYRMGSFLTGLKHESSEWELRDVRNLTREGKEEPPMYEVVQLNSKLSDTFLTDGIHFYADKSTDERICVKVCREYKGISVITYAVRGKTIGTDTIEKSWDFAHKNNFLKGEAFSLSGEFITRGTTSWDDVFLEDANRNVLQRTIRLLNKQQDEMPNRGVIVMGPPGTGKTLSGRVILNDAKATFIWVAAKDFWCMGALSGLCEAFSLAKELAPAVIFMEDVDNWMSSYAVDVMKTEMDGIGRTKGIATILTTNYPERFPDALIDRPGRFHDVLMFDLPSERVRREMLIKWTGDAVKGMALDSLVNKTKGYSGAHIYELVYFAKTLQTEYEGMEMETALVKALEKIDTQRELLDQSQLAGSHFRDMKGLTPKAKQYMESLPPITLSRVFSNGLFPTVEIKAAERITVLGEKAGRVLSAANLKMLTDTLDDMHELLGNEKGISRGGCALCERCVSRLEKVVAACQPSEDEEKPEKEFTTKDAMALFIAESSEADREKMLAVLQAMESIKATDNKVQQYKALVGLKSG